MRLENTPDLFGRGAGIGTDGNIICEFCGKSYQDREYENGNAFGESIDFTTFAGKQVCVCCFELIEDEILSRMDDILIWYYKYLKSLHNSIHVRELNIDSILKEFSKIKVLTTLPKKES